MITKFKLYESFIDSENGYYINRNGTIIFTEDNDICVALNPYTDHSTRYHIYTVFNVNDKVFEQLNVDIAKFTYELPEDYFKKDPDKMLEISYLIFNGELDERESYRNRQLKYLIIEKWFNKIPELKEAYNLKIQTNKYNL